MVGSRTCAFGLQCIVAKAAYGQTDGDSYFELHEWVVFSVYDCEFCFAPTAISQVMSARSIEDGILL